MEGLKKGNKRVTCPDCKKEISIENRFCPICGCDLEFSVFSLEDLEEPLEKGEDYDFTVAFKKIKANLHKKTSGEETFENPKPKKSKISEDQDYDFEGALRKIKTALHTPPKKRNPIAPPPDFSEILPVESTSLLSEYLELARGFLENCQYGRAMEKAEKILQKDPNQQEAQSILREASEKEKLVQVGRERCRTYELISNYEMAYYEWARVAALLPYQAECQEKLQELLGKINQLEQEREQKRDQSRVFTKKRLATRAIHGQTTSIETELNQAQQHIKSAKFKKAKKIAQKILQVDHNHLEAQKILEQTGEMNNELAKFYQRAQKYEQQQDWLSALFEWEKITRLVPFNKSAQKKIIELQALVWQGVHIQMETLEKCFEQGQFRKVLVLGGEILKAQPNHPYCTTLFRNAQASLKTAQKFLKQAKKYSQVGKWDDAEEMAREALDLDDQLEEAQAILQKVSKKGKNKRPHHDSGLYNKINVLLQEVRGLIKEKDFGGALQRVKEILVLDPSRKDLLVLFEKLVLKKRDRQEWKKKTARLPRKKSQLVPWASEEGQPLPHTPEESHHFTTQDLEDTLKNALLELVEKEEEGLAHNREESAVRAILGLVEILIQQDKREIALQELEEGLQKYPDHLQLKRELRMLKAGF